MRYGAILLFCCVALLLGASTQTLEAASDTTTITIDAKFWYGWFWRPMVQGTFEATGDVEDDGGAAGSLTMVLVQPPYGYEAYWTVWLTGDKGTLIVEISTQDDSWEVAGGTGDYAGVSGSGTYEEQWTAGSFYLTSYVTWTLSGSVDT
jgi:hypothetical protein